MAPLGKRTIAVREGVDRTKLYPLEEAVKMVKERAKAKFDETIEIAMNLGVDPRHADQMVRGVVELPNGTGKKLRVAVLGYMSVLLEWMKCSPENVPNLLSATTSAQRSAAQYGQYSAPTYTTCGLPPLVSGVLAVVIVWIACG